MFQKDSGAFYDVSWLFMALQAHNFKRFQICCKGKARSFSVFQDVSGDYGKVIQSNFKASQDVSESFQEVSELSQGVSWRLKAFQGVKETLKAF